MAKRKLHRKEPYVAQKKKYCVIIESGHGKRNWWPYVYDPGVVYRGKSGIMKERDYTILIGAEIESTLAGNVEEVVTVGTYTNAPLRAKLKYINDVIEDRKKRGMECIVVSVHVNGHGNHDANGFEVWTDSSKGNESYELSAQIVKMLSLTGLRNGGVKEENKKSRPYMRYVYCPAALVECGFITNYTDRAYLYKNWRFYGDYIANAILSYIKLNE